MNAIVTGAAGFIGSTLCQHLLEQGWKVTGVDVITDYYSPEIKRANLDEIAGHSHFNFIQEDILNLNWSKLYDEHDYVFHLAGQPGVRASWGTTFSEYTRNNISTAQHMLHSAIGKNIKKFVYAATSSIYGDAEQFPTKETVAPRPVSPYGVTKLAAENLCYLYFKNYDVPTVSLRYFTVYGPGQRPDMAFHKLFKAVSTGATFNVYGDGKQTRDFTFVADIVNGTRLAALNGKTGEIYNLGGGTRVSMLDIFSMVEKIVGKPIILNFSDQQKGDARDTSADIEKACKELSYLPRVSIEEGLIYEWEWFKTLANY